jgi:hypothetical protein
MPPIIPNSDDQVSRFIDLSLKKGGYLYIENNLKLSSYNVNDIMPYIKRNFFMDYNNKSLKSDVINNVEFKKKKKNDIFKDYNDNFFEKKSYQSIKLKNRNKNKGGLHLIIMQHGLQVPYFLS